MSAEEGRRRLERMKRFQLLERLSGLAMLIAIPVFALSYWQLRAIDDAVKGRGVGAVPWAAWTAVGLFVVGFGCMRLAKHRVDVDHKALVVEDRARKLESLDAESEARQDGVSGDASGGSAGDLADDAEGEVQGS
jgi:hypothetical protein